MKKVGNIIEGGDDHHGRCCCRVVVGVEMCAGEAKAAREEREREGRRGSGKGKDRGSPVTCRSRTCLEAARKKQTRGSRTT